MESGVLVENEQFLLELELLEISRQTPVRQYAKSVKKWSFSWSVIYRTRVQYGDLDCKSSSTGKYGPEKTTYLDIFHALRKMIGTIGHY